MTSPHHFHPTKGDPRILRGLLIMLEHSMIKKQSMEQMGISRKSGRGNTTEEV